MAETIQTLVLSAYMDNEVQWYDTLGVPKPSTEDYDLYLEAVVAVKNVLETLQVEQQNRPMQVDEDQLAELSKIIMQVKELQYYLKYQVTKLVNDA
jgi:hypothetical protein